MIQNWDLVEHRDENTDELRYALLMDGTEADARMMAKKLGKNLQPPTLAEPPFTYRFLLTGVLDEIRLEKIRTAVQEGVEAANRMNQFAPGGVLGDPLFTNDPDKTQTTFPTFFATTGADSSPETNTEESWQKELDLDLVTRRLSIKEDELTETQTPAKAPAKPEAKEEPEPEEKPVEKPTPEPEPKPAPEEKPAPNPAPEEKTAPEPAPEPVPELKTEPAGKPMPEPAPELKTKPVLPTDEKPFYPNETTARKPNLAPDIADMSFFAKPPAQPANENITPSNAEPAPSSLPSQEEPAPATPTSAAPENTATEKKTDFPFNDGDMLIKDMEDTLLGENNMELEDIFAAQTKLGSFVDVNELVQQKQKQDKFAQAAGSKLPDDTVFDVFEQDLKDQTSIIDLTQLRTKKKEEKPAQPEPDKTVQIPAAAPFATSANPEPPAQTPLQKEMDEAQSLPEITLRKPQTTDFAFPPEETPAEPPAAGNPAQTAIPAEKKSPDATAKTTGTNFVTTKSAFFPRKQTMQDHQKTILKLKPKAQTPQPPVFKPAAPAAPAAPAVPAAAPKAPISTPKPPAEKKHTLDHSIQMPKSELKKHNWPLEIPLIPTYTLNNMVMTVNRFAHATAISVLESPGKLYNPLVFHGASGTGKSHLLNAMAFAFSQKFGQTNIFMTNGVRLSRGIQRYIMEGNIEKFDRFISSVKVLLIDDIHLLAVNEQNRSYISKLLNTFLKEQKQIIITSKYPPESLEKLEELIKFRLDSGWISELKPSTGHPHIKIVKKMLVDNRVNLTDAQVEEFFGRTEMTLGAVSRSIRRLKVLENLLPPPPDNKPYSQAAILEKLIPCKGEDTDSLILSTDPNSITSITPRGNGEWGRIGIFYPQKYADRMNWMVFALQQRAKELGLEGGFDIVVRSSYATENIISSAFKIANLCDNKKLKGAIILGPRYDECDPSVRENFYDILTHMLEVMLIRCGVINEENVRLPSTYVEVLAELMR